MTSFDLTAYRPTATRDLIRAGKKNDGGYVLPKALIDQSQALLSLGVNLDWSFEQSLLRINPGLKVVCVDGTTGLGKAIGKSFQKFFDMLGHLVTFQLDRARRDGEFVVAPFGFIRFFSRHPLVKKMVGDDSRAGYVSVGTLFREHFGAVEHVLLKMDIEGFEYEALPLDQALYPRISGIVIEFHDLDRHWEQFRDLMAGLMKEFDIAHVHGNNNRGYIPGSRIPQVLEITLINKRLQAAVQPGPERVYPLAGLDMPCNPKFPELEISFQ